ncbi:ferredoxin [Streptomyces sp. NPDC052023]|uniref:ferredoxin n=1 Tax=Streptomyces sp. NPDC052023 TaxID=3365681 RepID=UPI0037CFA0ED
MRLVVDLNRCQGYAQCVFLATDVFALHGDEGSAVPPDGVPMHGTGAAVAAGPSRHLPERADRCLVSPAISDI